MSNFVKLTYEVLNIGDISNLVTDSSTGAISLFVGTTRDHFKNKRVVRLEYEAYDKMAEKKMLELCQLMRGKWPALHNIAIYHRLGEVKPREASVVIAVSSQHRQASLESVQYAIDTLKATVPIWKKEVYEDGTEWKANAECPWTSPPATKPVALPKIDPSLVQITATEEEVDSRIEAFIARKRAEVDLANVQEFCSRSTIDEFSEFSCARTDSIVVRRTGSSSHLRKSNAVNAWGPQTKGDSTSKAAGVKGEDQQQQQDLPAGLGERLNHLEEHLFGDNRPVPKDVYARLKLLEERVLYLEGISPEYFSAAQNVMAKMSKQCKEESDAKIRKTQNDDEVMTSLTNINKRIQELRSSLLVDKKTGIKMEQ